MGVSKISLWQLMMATGIVGVLTGLFARSPGIRYEILAIYGIALTVGILLVFGISRLPRRIRIPLEVAILVLLLALSAEIWTPSFYRGEPERCYGLARQASMAVADGPEMRAALNRESAWFSRKGAELRRRGLWIGLTWGPCSRDEAYCVGREEVYQLGVTESMEKHEEALRQILSRGSLTP
jgi:hypothetical protein